jgi:RNA polymerase sigma factor (sigma-70 family)
MTDPSKLAKWFEAYAAALVLYARQWVGDRARAEDVVQEVFVRLMAQPAEPPNVKAWLHASVRHAAIDEARSSDRRRRREETAAAIRPSSGWFDARPDDLIDAQAAEQALQDLPPRQREVVVLRLWSGMTLQEISQVTGLPISTAHDEYRRGLEAIRRAMETRRCTPTTTTQTDRPKTTRD